MEASVALPSPLMHPRIVAPWGTSEYNGDDAM